VARLFVAAWLPGHVLEAVAALDRPEAPGVRWTGPEHWHVTLRFLGDAEPAEAEAALAGLSVAPAVAEVGPAVRRLGRGVLMLPVRGLDDVAAAVAAATDGVGQPPEDRRFKGHVTLARLRDRAKPPKGVVGTPFSASFPLSEITLVQSHLGQGPARYETLARFAF
jgi:2'-5' RNA ligase